MIIYIHRYGYLAVFLGIMLENAGVPMPGETMLLAASALAAKGNLSLVAVIPIAALAAILGDNIGFFIGRKGGRLLLGNYGHYLFIKTKHIESADAFFMRYGPVAVLLARFVAGARVLMAIVAGSSKMPWGKFLIFNALGAFLWSSTISILGYYGLTYGNKLLIYLRSFHVALFVSITAVILIWVIIRLVKTGPENSSY